VSATRKGPTSEQGTFDQRLITSLTPLHILIGKAVPVVLVGLDLSVSAFARPMQRAVLHTFWLLMPIVLLSRLLTPIRNMADVLQLATCANPLRFGTSSVRGVYLQELGGQRLA